MWVSPEPPPLPPTLGAQEPQVQQLDPPLLVMERERGQDGQGVRQQPWAQTHASSPRSGFPSNRQALEVHNGLGKLNLWAGNGSREIEEQRNRACEPGTDAPS